MKVRVQNMDIQEKIVILRCDFNVPIQNGIILDDTKIKESLETIKYLQSQNSRIVILSHLGKVKSENDKKLNTLQPVAVRLNELLESPVTFSKQCRNMALWERTHSLNAGEVILLENTRFEDFPEPFESNCDTQLAMYWATLGDVFINDAFGSSHRVHASTAGIAKYLPSGIGFLVQKELENLEKYVLKPEHPFTVIMGGGKTGDKLGLIETLLPKCDHLLLGGKIANNFLHALGFNPGFTADKDDPEMLSRLRELMLANKEKIMLPLDVVVSSSYDASVAAYRLVDKVEPNDLIYDIGAKSIEKYKSAINESKTVFMNGTVGVYEDSRFANGTKEILNLLSESSASTIIGGGDAVSAVKKFNFADKMTYLSSGGGASLEFIIQGKLAALDYIDDEEGSYEILDI